MPSAMGWLVPSSRSRPPRRQHVDVEAEGPGLERRKQPRGTLVSPQSVPRKGVRSEVVDFVERAMGLEPTTLSLGIGLGGRPAGTKMSQDPENIQLGDDAGVQK